METFLITCGGRIRCRRCTARSKRSQQQCSRPALSESPSAKCSFHGGRSSGPTSESGRQRVAQANTTHGRLSKKARQATARISAEISALEDVARLLGLVDGARQPGRKSSQYKPVHTIAQAWRFMVDIRMAQSKDH